MVVPYDAAYGAEYDKFETAGFDPAACFTNWAEFADIAIGLGDHGVTVRSEAELVAAIENLHADDASIEIPRRSSGAFRGWDAARETNRPELEASAAAKTLQMSTGTSAARAVSRFTGLSTTSPATSRLPTSSASRKSGQSVRGCVCLIFASVPHTMGV